MKKVGANIFIASGTTFGGIGSDNLMISQDGVTWSGMTIDKLRNYEVNYIVYGRKKFVALADLGVLYYSNNQE